MKQTNCFQQLRVSCWKYAFSLRRNSWFLVDLVQSMGYSHSGTEMRHGVYIIHSKF